jgi:ribonuclease J
MPRENVLVVENGYILEFTPEHASIGERVPGGYVFVDGAGVGDVGPTLLREREQLASDGFVVAVLTLRPDLQLAFPPQIVTRGFVFQPQAGELLDELAMCVICLLEEGTFDQDAALEDAVRRTLEEYIYQETKRRPIVIPVLNRCNFS